MDHFLEYAFVSVVELHQYYLCYRLLPQYCNEGSNSISFFHIFLHSQFDDETVTFLHYKFHIPQLQLFKARSPLTREFLSRSTKYFATKNSRNSISLKIDEETSSTF